MKLDGKIVLITGSARRVGRALALATAEAGGDVIIHHGHSPRAAQETQEAIQALGRKAYVLQADLGDAQEASQMIDRALRWGPLFALVNSAAIFEPLRWDQTHLEDWEQHLTINLTAPFLLSQAFAKSLPLENEGRIVNILDWRAMRPGVDHLPYTISKAALAALTRSLAASLAPRITVNGLALGAILPPSDGAESNNILKYVPAGRWAELAEVGQALVFLLGGPSYITGEIIHVDGGRHII